MIESPSCGGTGSLVMLLQERTEDDNRAATTVMDIGTRGHAGELTCAVFCSHGGLLITGGDDGAVCARRWLMWIVCFRAAEGPVSGCCDSAWWDCVHTATCNR